MIRIAKTNHAVIKEPLLSPFGFKGAYLTKLWQSIAMLRDENGAVGIGAGVQSVLWSDAQVFVQYGEEAGNELMAGMTRYALSQLEGNQYNNPFEMLDAILPEVYKYGLKTAEYPGLKNTFALNALVTVDQAAWALFSRGKGLRFEELVPGFYRSALTEPKSELAGIPLIPYGMSNTGITQILDDGYFLLKIKVGSDPNQDGNLDSMLAWDCQRLSQIHSIASRYETVNTVNGKIAYYLDANGRYDGKDRLFRLLEHVDRIGALDRIVLFEEPFPEEQKIDVHSIPVRIAADESIHNETDALELIELGYGALTLKPVAKTMCMSLKVAKLATDKGISCFCADLTANPVLVDWNKNLASRLPLLPELKVGIIETNGHQNYCNWERMKNWHPRAGSQWIDPVKGVYRLNNCFHDTAGGALEIAGHYESLLLRGQSQ